MKSIITLALLVVATTTFSQSKYEQGMTKAFELWEADKIDEAANLFERIATADTEQWLPAYYVAQIYIIKNWQDFENRTETSMKANLDKAQEYINELETRSPENTYGDFLQAQLFTAWVAHDGMKYGMKYAGRIGEMYSKMSKEEPENPIFMAAKAEWDMGSATYFGTSIEPYCAELNRAIELFATFKPETQFHPSGSVEQTRKAAEACNK